MFYNSTQKNIKSAWKQKKTHFSTLALKRHKPEILKTVSPLLLLKVNDTAITKTFNKRFTDLYLYVRFHLIVGYLPTVLNKHNCLTVTHVEVKRMLTKLQRLHY